MWCTCLCSFVHFGANEAGVVADLVVGRKDQVWLHTPSQQLQLSVGRLWYTVFALLVPVLWVHLQVLYEVKSCTLF